MRACLNGCFAISMAPGELMCLDWRHGQMLHTREPWESERGLEVITFLSNNQRNSTKTGLQKVKQWRSLLTEIKREMTTGKKNNSRHPCVVQLRRPVVAAPTAYAPPAAPAAALGPAELNLSQACWECLVMVFGCCFLRLSREVLKTIWWGKHAVGASCQKCFTLVELASSPFSFLSVHDGDVDVDDVRDDGHLSHFPHIFVE